MGKGIARLLIGFFVFCVSSRPACFAQALANCLLEDPRGHALEVLHKALLRAKKKKGKARLVFFGASHTAWDLYTGILRRELQRRFGDGGHGFVMPAKPWNSYSHMGVLVESTNTWHTDRVGKSDERGDGLYGVAGMSVASASPQDFGRVKLLNLGRRRSRGAVFEIFYLRQPEGGTMEIRIGKRREVISTSGEIGLGIASFRVNDVGEAFEIRPIGNGEVRLFGLNIERARPGVIVDSMGIPGARAADMLRWHFDLFAQGLGHLRPDLVALAFGTNESGDDRVPLDQYEATLREVLERVRRAAPNASCLLIGPSDWPLRQQDGSLAPRPRTEAINQIQSRMAAEFGCAFFDLLRFTGGPLSIAKWARQGLAQKDLVHFTKKGYEKLGLALVKALVRSFSLAKRQR